MELEVIYLLEPVNVGNATTAFYNTRDYEIKRVEKDLFMIKSKFERAKPVYVTMHQVKYFTLIEEKLEQGTSQTNTSRAKPAKRTKAEQTAVL